MPPVLTSDQTAPVSLRTRSARLAARLEQNARALAEFARPLSDAAWQTALPGDGRRIGVIVHHVATVYPLEVHLAEMIAAGTPIVGVTWATIHAMNAAHAAENGGVTKEETLALLAANSAAAADTIRAFTEEQLDYAVPVSLYGDAELTCQFMLEDHAVRHACHHLSRVRAALQQSGQI